MKIALKKFKIEKIDINLENLNNEKKEEQVALSVTRSKFLGENKNKSNINAIKVKSVYSFRYNNGIQSISFDAIFSLINPILKNEAESINNERANEGMDAILWASETPIIKDLLLKFGIDISGGLPVGVPLDV